MDVVSVQIVSTAVILVYIWIIRAEVRDMHEENVKNTADFQRNRDIFRQERIRRDIAGLRERVTRLERQAGCSWKSWS